MEGSDFKKIQNHSNIGYPELEETCKGPRVQLLALPSTSPRVTPEVLMENAAVISADCPRGEAGQVNVAVHQSSLTIYTLDISGFYIWLFRYWCPCHLGREVWTWSIAFGETQ